MQDYDETQADADARFHNALNRALLSDYWLRRFGGRRNIKRRARDRKRLLITLERSLPSVECLARELDDVRGAMAHLDLSAAWEDAMLKRFP